MGCIIEFNNQMRFNFAENKYKQKIWIEALLRFSKLDLNTMAMHLELPVDMLAKVQCGSVFFSKNSAERLGQLFLLAFSQ